VELKANLLAPARSGTVKARGDVLKASGTLTVCHGDAVEVRGEQEVHVATMLATMIAREEDPPALEKRCPGSAVVVPYHPGQHRPKGPVFLAVD
jgi:hypothetical protein